jgi:hypothetical protein
MVSPIHGVRSLPSGKDKCGPGPPIIRLEGVEVVSWESYQAQCQGIVVPGVHHGGINTLTKAPRIVPLL